MQIFETWTNKILFDLILFLIWTKKEAFKHFRFESQIQNQTDMERIFYHCSINNFRFNKTWLSQRWKEEAGVLKLCMWKHRKGSVCNWSESLVREVRTGRLSSQDCVEQEEKLHCQNSCNLRWPSHAQSRLLWPFPLSPKSTSFLLQHSHASRTSRPAVWWGTECIFEKKKDSRWQQPVQVFNGPIIT